MTHAEFLQWVEFYRLHPFDDLHRLHRPAALIAAAVSDGKVKERLDWLAPEPLPVGYSQAELNSFKAFGIKPPDRRT